MITAQQAKLISMSANKIKCLEDQIKLAAEQGGFELVPRMNLDYSDKELLQKHGYTVATRRIRPSGGFGGISDDGDEDVEQTYINWSR